MCHIYWLKISQAYLSKDFVNLHMVFGNLFQFGKALRFMSQGKTENVLTLAKRVYNTWIIQNTITQ